MHLIVNEAKPSLSPINLSNWPAFAEVWTRQSVPVVFPGDTGAYLLRIFVSWYKPLTTETLGFQGKQVPAASLSQ
jgi:hypothetical protein